MFGEEIHAIYWSFTFLQCLLIIFILLIISHSYIVEMQIHSLASKLAKEIDKNLFEKYSWNFFNIKGHFCMQNLSQRVFLHLTFAWKMRAWRQSKHFVFWQSLLKYTIPAHAYLFYFWNFANLPTMWTRGKLYIQMAFKPFSATKGMLGVSFIYQLQFIFYSLTRVCWIIDCPFLRHVLHRQ